MTSFAQYVPKFRRKTSAQRLGLLLVPDESASLLDLAQRLLRILSALKG
ncbi:MAG: hypothetical protein LC808_38890 [Actinobacteria bacterium]|nr:hypothetical protein [Actinomycetota bacterium]